MHDRPSRAWLAPLLIVIVGVAVYANALGGPFLLDDHRTLDENESIRQLASIGAVLHPPAQSPVTGRPLVNLTFALNYAGGGLSVAGYHAVNIGIHILAALALIGVLRWTFARTAALRNDAAGISLPLVCALVWLVHPLNSEAVNYVTQRTESLMGLFYLLALYAAIRAAAPTARRRWTSIAVIAAFCAVASKETALTLPLVIVFWDRAFVFSSLRDAWMQRWRLYTMVTASWLLFAVFARELPFFAEGGFAQHVSRWTYLLSQGPMIAQYLKLTAWPWPLVFDYGAPAAVTLAAVWLLLLLVLVLLAATIVALARWPSLGFWGAWFFITLAPASSLIPIPTEVGAERRMYLPLIAIIALVAIAGRRLTLPLVRRTVAIGLVIALGALTIRRNVDYQSGLAIWQTSLDRWPQVRAHEHLSMFLRDAGRIDDSIAELKIAAPASANARHALASALLERGDVAGSIAEFRRFVADDPHNKDIVSAREEFALALLRAGDAAGAVNQLREVTRTMPQYASGYLGLADALMQTRDVAGAVAAYRRVLQLQPDNVIALANLGLILSGGGEHTESMTLLRRAVTLEPRALAPRKQIVRLLLAEGRYDEMAAEARTLTSMAPGDVEGHNLLGVALASSRQFAAAREQFELVLRLDPSNQDARANLARVTALALPAQGRE